MFSWLYYLLGIKDISLDDQTKMLYKSKEYVLFPTDEDTDLFDGPFRYC